MPGAAKFLTCEADYALILCNFVKRYCVFDNTPRNQTVSIDRVILEAPCWLFRTVSVVSWFCPVFKFLLLSCPDSRGEDLSKCECEIGIGFSEDAPDTPTCRSCSFCSDGTLNYNCENVAGGTCIGRTCDGSCIVSLEYASAAVAHWTPISLWITATLPFLGFL
jgi:hypothetical protein